MVIVPLFLVKIIKLIDKVLSFEGVKFNSVLTLVEIIYHYWCFLLTKNNNECLNKKHSINNKLSSCSENSLSFGKQMMTRLSPCLLYRSVVRSFSVLVTYILSLSVLVRILILCSVNKYDFCQISIVLRCPFFFI